MQNKQSFSSMIIGISGISGSGKTTLTTALGKSLNATTIHWDDYDDISSGPADYLEWQQSQQGFDVWKYPTLAEHIQLLKCGQTIRHPHQNTLLKSTNPIIFDAPLGRRHTETGRYIDLHIHVDTPLDIALARRLLRDFTNPSTAKQDLLEEIDHYVNQSRSLFTDTRIKANADLLIDGTLPIAQQCQKALSALSDPPWGQFSHVQSSQPAS